MPTYEVVQVDAFASRPLEGNPCAVVPDARGLDDALMQKIAREMNLSETAYVFEGERSDFRVRYFTPAFELPMAGHPTLSTVHVLCELGKISAKTTTVTLEMPAGVIPVRIERGESASRYVMQQLPPTFMRTYPHKHFAHALGLAAEDLLEGVFPQTVSTGTPQIMIALRSTEALARCRPQRAALFEDVDDRDYVGVHIFARETEGGIALRARHFVDFGGVLIEDPFTGSASGGMAGYCAFYGLLPERSYRIAQGDHVGRPGIGYVRVIGEPDAIETIEIGGEVVTVMRGQLSI
ncbi:MAG: PhzF family phenazine biosynthesis protein [Candidatus Eremiobacteraeota bacterium]|nr:PhzF family phenazine biosynthesis protein [Candidatus Eremiobacteraeota bacterium]